MGDWKTHLGGEKVTPTEQDEWVQEKEYATTALRDAASSGWGSAELFRQCKVVETGKKYYWNGAAWVGFPSEGGAGAPVDASYVTVNAEAGLNNESLHKDLAGANLHDPKAHAASHQNAGADEINVVGLSGLLADEQDAGKIKGKTVDDAAIGANKFLKYDGANIVYSTLAGGGDMAKAVYDIGDNGVVDNSEKLEASTKAQVQNHTPIAHKDRHKTGGGDPFLLTDLLDCVARTAVRKNSVPVYFVRRILNFIEGAGITLTISDDAGLEEVDINIAATAATEYTRGTATGASPISVAHGLGEEPEGVTLGANALQPYALGYATSATHITIYHNAAGSLKVAWWAWKA